MSGQQQVSAPAGEVTGGPWRVTGTEVNGWCRAGRQVVAQCYIEYPAQPGARDPLGGCNQPKHDAEANAARIVACVNAMQDIADPVVFRAAVADLIADRDRLANIVRSHEAQIERMTAKAADLVEVARKVYELSDAVVDHGEGNSDDYGLKLFSDVFAAHGSPNPAPWYVEPLWETELDAKAELVWMRVNAYARLGAALAGVQGGAA